MLVSDETQMKSRYSKPMDIKLYQNGIKDLTKCCHLLNSKTVVTQNDTERNSKSNNMLSPARLVPSPYYLVFGGRKIGY